ncbi:MAG: aromatic ring-hydroxylating dioxygenase subunit alpha, partial [Halieaceae bacterium]|nr:aromatic ring-hydroxylating dioxygenase subunit alpha [Halieaceae bacterium]
MAAFLSDREVAQRLLHHIANKTTDAGEDLWCEPVQHYLCPVRFEDEMQTVLRRYPTPFCPAAALPEAGSYVARTAAGIPLVVVRGEDGIVRGFRNACRHRGAQVAQDSGCARAFRCSYHGWTYRLDGALQHVPHEAGFPGLDKTQHGLSAVRVQERAGVIFVSQQAQEICGNLDELPEFFSENQQLFNSSEYTLDVNWKVFLESFLEGYHIKPAHRETFYPFGFDNLNLVETVGRNSRITFPFQRIIKLAEIAPDQREVDGLLTYVYHLFPNVTIAVLSHHTTMLILEPVDVNKTQVISYSLTNRALEGEEALEKARNDAAFVRTTGQSEDIALA